MASTRKVRPKVLSRWRPIPKYDGKYWVSSNGTVLSFAKNKRKVVCGSPNEKGYIMVELCKDGKTAHVRRGRLVLSCFLGNQNTLECNHKDGIKQNDRVENLEWVTRNQNMKHAFLNGLTHPSAPCGEMNGSARLSRGAVREIRTKYAGGGYSQHALGELFHVSRSTIECIVNNKTWGWIT